MGKGKQAGHQPFLVAFNDSYLVLGKGAKFFESIEELTDSEGRPSRMARVKQVYFLFNLDKKTFHYLPQWSSFQKTDAEKSWLDVGDVAELSHSYTPDKKLKPGNVKRPGHETVDDLRHELEQTFPHAIICPWVDEPSIAPTDEHMRVQWQELLTTLTLDLASVLEDDK